MTLIDAVCTLQAQLDFVLSFLGLQGNSSADVSGSLASAETNIGANVLRSLDNGNTGSLCAESSAGPTQNDRAWSSIVRSNPIKLNQNSSVQLSDKLRTNLLSAVGYMWSKMPRSDVHEI